MTYLWASSRDKFLISGNYNFFKQTNPQGGNSLGGSSLLNWDNVYTFCFATKFTFIAQNPRKTSFLCVFWSQMGQKAVYQNILLTWLWVIYSILQVVWRFFLKAQLDHFVFGHIWKHNYSFSNNPHFISLWNLNISCDF